MPISAFSGATNLAFPLARDVSGGTDHGVVSRNRTRHDRSETPERVRCAGGMSLVVPRGAILPYAAASSALRPFPT
jgi:hypothetical protein